MKIRLDDAQHPIRQLAILILEEVIDSTGKNIKNENWYYLEDYITHSINNFINKI